MADQIDHAQQLDELMREEALRNHGRQRRVVLGDADRVVAPSACIDCGDDIAAERMAALPEAVRCVGCQALWERWT